MIRVHGECVSVELALPLRMLPFPADTRASLARCILRCFWKSLAEGLQVSYSYREGCCGRHQGRSGTQPSQCVLVHASPQIRDHAELEGNIQPALDSQAALPGSEGASGAASEGVENQERSLSRVRRHFEGS